MAIIYEDALKAQLKLKNTLPVYVIAGDDGYLKQLYVDKIISLSADAFTEDIRRAYASGMNDHVSKPIVPEELFAAITRVLKTLN